PVQEIILAPWIPMLHADWGFLLDPLSSVMILIVTGVGFLIHVYSIGYMRGDPGYGRFFGCMNLFVFAMLLLVLANNYVLLFAGWEGVGLASYLLIGFYFERNAAANAGKKAFLVNRIGDAAFILGLLLMLAMVGSTRFVDVDKALSASSPSLSGVYTAMALLLLAGAIGKSAQFPLHVWLPDAMEGPTPVSALIHAATMVTAGVYLIARAHVLFQLAPRASEITAVIGAFTAILAASIAMVQNDIKRVLAYSTVSQLGYMFLALGVGAYWVAIFHLVTHAFFKALLFLGAGSVIHALGGEQDLRNMGALRKRLPITHWTMLIAALAISGFPGLAGFFSKDEILAQVYGSAHGSKPLYIVGIVTALMTAFYMWRLMYLAFYGEFRGTTEHVHESPAVMTGPLVILAAGCIGAGWLGVPRAWTAFGSDYRALELWLEPVFGAHVNMPGAAEWLLLIIPLSMAVGGWWLASRLYAREWRGPLFQALHNKWYFDRIYDTLLVRGLTIGSARACADFDVRIVDGGVNGAGALARLASRASIWWDAWIVDGAVRLTSGAVKLSSVPARILETGSVQSYALLIVAGAAAFLSFYVTR
ncbi:MAG: NADH-quinone oxidoreductase subunit L, partial [Bryobacteraceae bacterium]